MLTATREAVAHYDALLFDKHRESTQAEFARAIERHHLYLDDRPRCDLLRPHMVDAQTYDRARRAAALVNRGIVGLVERLLRDPALLEAAGVPSYFEPILAIDRDTGGPCTMARLDGFLDETGTIKFIEYNTDPWGGTIAESDEFDAAFSAMPIAKEFAARFPFTTVRVLDLVLEALYVDHERAGGRGPPAIAMVDTTTKPTLLRELSYAASRGCPVVSAALDELFEEDGELFVEDQRVDVVFIPWPQLLEVLLGGGDAGKPLRSALARRSVRTLTGVSRGLLSGAKILFDLLSDPAHAHLFDRDVAEALARHVPWTRRVRDCKTPFGNETIDLLPYIEAHPERFALKPSGGQDGKGVVLGWECDRAEWQQTLKRAMSRPHVVQERVSPPAQPFPALVDGTVGMVDRLVDFNPYIWNADRIEGALVRANKSGRLNIYAGGSVPGKWILTAT